LNLALKIDNSSFQIGDFVVGHRCDLDVARSGKLAIIVQVALRRFEFIPTREQFLDARMLAHDIAGAFPVIEKMWVRDFAFELFEPFAFAFD
jgi:hypothetical protein